MTFVAVFFLTMMLYVSGLLWLALKVERTASLRRIVSSNPYVYALGLTIYMTAWTFYGNVGQAAGSGIQFLISFTGTFFGVMSWWWVLRRIVRIKNIHKITSIADFMSARYGKSHVVAGLVTFVFFLGSLPYVSIQFKAILSTLSIMLDHGSMGTFVSPATYAGPAIVAFTTLFTIMAGVRKLDPTERHSGVMAVVAFESLVKLAAVLVVGAYVTFGLHDGFADVITKGLQAGYGNLFSVKDAPGGTLDWVSRIFIFAPAVLLLPRQFHLAVVENSNESHIRTAMWVLPLYMLLITLFVMPMALAGLLAGMGAGAGDWFVLLLPMQHGQSALALFVFIGGFSAGMSMIVVTTMTMTTMITNDLLLPLLDYLPRLAWMRRYLLQCRWAVVGLYLSFSYMLFLLVGESYSLVSLGVMSMVAAIQLVPGTIGGLYWEKGNRAGMISGILAGFAVWGYTLVLPVMARSGVLDAHFLAHGPWGILWLHPERLFGLHVFEPLMHTVFWSLLLNGGCYVIGSCLWKPRERDITSAAEYVRVFESATPQHDAEQVRNIVLATKRSRLLAVFSAYYPKQVADNMVRSIIAAAGLSGLTHIAVVELATLTAEAKKQLAGMVGSASAAKIMDGAVMFTDEERAQLASAYKSMLAGLAISPDELLRRLDYYRERETLLRMHADEQEEKNRQLTEEMAVREQVQKELKVAEERYRSIFENAVEGIFQTLPEGTIMHANPAAARILGYGSVEELVRTVTNLRDDLYVDGAERDRFVSELSRQGFSNHFETRLYRKDRTPIWVALHSRAIRDDTGTLLLIEGIMEDISDRKRAEDEMVRAGAFISGIIDAMPSVLIAVTQRLRVVHWNREAAHYFGITREDATDARLPDLLSHMAVTMETLTDMIRESFATGEMRQRSRIRDEAGQDRRVLDMTVFPLDTVDESKLMVVRMDDATSRVRMEEVMVQTEKMMSVGGLAAGMAHEINNPLGAVLLGVQNVLRRIDPARPANEGVAKSVGVSLEAVYAYLNERKVLDLLRGVRVSGERAADIVANMLEFSRRSDDRFTEESIGLLLDKAVALARNDYDLKKKYDFRQVEIIREYAENVPPVPCNGTEIEQVVLNLLRNAAQAMYDHPIADRKPRITLRTAVQDAFVRIEVEDNGPGMDEATQRRVFEPFFTTKSVGAGTGLGLSVSYFIITTNHAGQFWVDSSDGQGTLFTILLPLHAAEGHVTMPVM